MTLHTIAAYIGVSLLAIVMGFQVLLALGRPLGRFAWGGKYRVLPTRLRWASLSAILILGLAAWMLLARAGQAWPGPEAAASRILAWVFAGYFTLNIVMNARSQSPAERYTMTPLVTLLTACCYFVALS